MFSLLAQSTYNYNYTYPTTTQDNTGFFLFSGLYFLFWMVFAAILLVALWKIFTKAGKPGWAALIPFYNIWVELEIIGRPGWWLLLFFIPVVNFVIGIIVAIDLAKSFGKSDVFGVVALFLFSIVGYLMLAFGDAKYVGPAASKGGGSAPAPAAPAA